MTRACQEAKHRVRSGITSAELEWPLRRLTVNLAPADLPKGTKWVYAHPFFMLLNVAVGGNWPGNPDATTVLPQTMFVDYVRVYKRH